MGVGRHRRDAGHAEVEGRHGVAELAGKWQHEAAEAGVHVQPDTAGASERRDVLHGIDDAVRERRGGRHERDGIARHPSPHRGHVRSEIGGHGHRHAANAKVLGGLVERRMGRRGDHDLGARDAAPLPRVIPIRFHRQQDALRAARGDGARDDRALGGRGGPEQVGGHADDLGLVLADARPDVGVQRIGLREQLVHAREEPEVLCLAVVDRARHVSALPALALELREPLHLLEHGVRRYPARRQPRVLARAPLVRPQAGLGAGEHLRVAALEPGLHERHGTGALVGPGEQARAHFREHPVQLLEPVLNRAQRRRPSR